MRIAATADLHFTAPNYERIRERMERVRDEADVLVLAGDLTNYGKSSEMEPLLNILVRLRIPIVAVLGNHDYESGQEQDLMRMMIAEGIKLLDGTGYERDGVGFAGSKGYIGGFGRGALTAFGEREIKAIVQSAIDEGLKLERALAQLRADRRVVVLGSCPGRRNRGGRVSRDLPVSRNFKTGGGSGSPRRKLRAPWSRPSWSIRR